MVAISSDILSGSGQMQALIAKNSTLSGTATGDSAQTASTRSGDTVTISEEARALFATKLQEYGVESPDQLTEKQGEEIKSAMDEALGQDAGTGEAASGTAASGQAASGSAKKSGGTQQGSGESSSDDDDEETDLENQISKLQEEISQLQGKATDDAEAKDELKTKRTELLALQTELAELQQQQA